MTKIGDFIGFKFMQNYKILRQKFTNLYGKKYTDNNISRLISVILYNTDRSNRSRKNWQVTLYNVG